MKAAEAVIAWTRTGSTWKENTAGRVRVGPLAGCLDWTYDYCYTGGALYLDRRNLPPALQIAVVFIDFNTLVVRDGIDPREAHAAFLAIDEYAEHISPDMAGARE